MEKTGRILKSISGFYDVLEDGTNELIRTRARGNFRKRNIKPVVGDHVKFEKNDELGYILEVEDRKNSLVRPPIANVDQAIVVTSAVEPNFSSNLLDKILLNIEHNNIQPLIYLTKTDLLSDESYEKLKQIIESYHEADYVTFTDRECYSPEQINRLKGYFLDKTTVFTGQSGAGKSTILNYIDPELALATAEISKALSRGKHTTRQVSLFDIAGGLVADTPGFSSLELIDIDEDELPTLFPEMVKYSHLCQFRGCMHFNEPNCAVKDQVEKGTIIKSRYKNYLYFLNEIRNTKKRY
ncbi:ribosome small subunit-dependent GTPase A [Lactobacillus terrae]|uniref:ribosome small subunit-dependent GTPase A n=1 Tax=Lactobacillus terrae TaxID=2269374 RepID=UPI000C1B62DC|nr:ribosome small subunit-dependent GTPase A [Lactobacillus terrae]